jgi:hypothetical protein
VGWFEAWGAGIVPRAKLFWRSARICGLCGLGRFRSGGIGCGVVEGGCGLGICP